MREIKFRGKRTDNGEWVYGCLVDNLWIKDATKEPVCEIITGQYDGDCWEDIAQDDAAIVEVDPATVGQFTGLKDKNGQEIYEGDIMDMAFYGVVIIVWNEEICAFQFAYKGMAKGTAIGGRITNTLFDHEAIKFKIGGNLIDNPELLQS